ncbi:MAG: autotransporter domain-containing protein [Akkermansia sp.]|nr:autotransporter domain-containing protein [Akkermansia sp.]
MRTLFLLSLISCGALASAATYSVSDANDFKAAWEAAVSGDSITLTGDVDLSQISTPLADKTGSISVQAAADAALTWSSDAGQTTLPSGMALSHITVINAPGTLSAPGVLIGEKVSFEQSQGKAPLLVAEGEMTLRSGTSFSHVVSATDGGALLVKKGTSVLVEGGVSFDSCASEALGGAIYVESQDSSDAYALVLKSDTAKGNITFTGNQSEATEESGLYTGFPNDVYLGQNAAMNLDAAEGSTISLSGGVESEDATALIVKTGAGEVLLGDGSYYGGMLSIQSGTVKLAEDAAWGDGSAVVQVAAGSTLSLADGSAIDGVVELGGKLAAAGVSSVSGDVTVQGTAAELDVAESLSLNGGLAGDADASLTKSGTGTLLLADAADFAGSLSVQAGSVELAENAAFGKAGSSLALAEKTTLVLNPCSAVQAALAMNAAAMEVNGTASLLSPSINLSGANTWTFRMTDDAVQSTTHRLQLAPAATVSVAEGGSLTLDVDMSGVTSTGDAEEIYLINTTKLTDSKLRELLSSAEVTLTDKEGTHETDAALDIATGTIDIAALYGEDAPVINFDRPGVSIANALHSSVGALHAFAAQSVQHLGIAAAAPAEGTNVWAAGIGHFDRYSGAWSYSGGGYAVGVSRSVSRSTVLGIAFGQMVGSNDARLDSADSDADATIDQSEIMVAVQARHAFDAIGGGTPILDVIGGFGMTDNDYESDTHEGSWDDTNFYASARLSWHWKNERDIYYAPFIGLEYLSGKQDSATLRGTAGSWESDGADMNILTLPVGVTMYSHLDIGDGMVLTPSLELSYRVDLTEADPATDCTDGTARWQSEGETRSRSAFELDAAARLQITPQWSTWAAYRYETRSSQSTHTISAGVNYRFW